MAKKSKSEAKKTSARTATKTPVDESIKKVRVRMYRHGLGDCFLLSFGSDPKLARAAHILVDCGTIGCTTTEVNMADVVHDIARTTGNRLSAIVATHEHLDHVSGFKSQRDAFGPKNMTVENSWLAWTEDPEDPLAKDIQKHRGDLGATALEAITALETVPKDVPRALGVASGVREVMSFFGDGLLGAKFAEGVNEAMEFVRTRVPEARREYMKPGTFLQPEWLPGVTVYVLGPPRDIKKIKNMGSHGDAELYGISERTLKGFRASVKWSNHDGDVTSYLKTLTPEAKEDLELCLPFDVRFRVPIQASDPRLASYMDEKNTWRRIDSDWLMGSADFALQLDNITNNTSLVLAFEIGENGPVVLMAGDAQLGNWLSWHEYTWKVPTADGGQREVGAKDLLARTVIYKVGHHSSHNATAVSQGLEMMTSKSLVALIPLDKEVAKKKKWPMPAEKLYRRLLEKTRGRVLRSDVGWPDDSECPNDIPKSQWKKVPAHMTIPFKGNGSDPIYIDVNISI